jgi:hemerythrin
MRTTLEGLVDYTQRHFAEEERMMKAHGYPDFETHCQAHDNLLAQVTDIRSRMDAGSVALSTDLFNFLKSWLINHIQQEDRGYGPFFNEKGVF